MKHMFMVGLLVCALMLVTRQALAVNELTGYGSWAIATAADPASNASRYVAAVTDQSAGVGASVWVGSWDSSGNSHCTNPYVSTPALPSTVSGPSVVAYSSPALVTNLTASTPYMLLFVTVYTSSTNGYLYYLSNTGGNACSGWTGLTWTQIAEANSHVVITAPGATTLTDSSGNTYDYVAVQSVLSGTRHLDVAYRFNGGSWGWDQTNTSSDWDSQPAMTTLLTSANATPQIYVFGVETGLNDILNDYSTSLNPAGTPPGLPTWASTTYTANTFVGELYEANEACSATGNSGASPESNDRIIVVCGDNSSPIHYWANIYEGTSTWAATTTWYDQGAPSFTINFTTVHASSRPAMGFFEDYANSTDWMILGEVNPFTSLGNTYTTFVESDYTTSWSSWAQRDW